LFAFEMKNTKVIYISMETHQRLKVWAAERGWTMMRAAEVCIEGLLKKQNKKTPASRG
jgi:hypothetical protein